MHLALRRLLPRSTHVPNRLGRFTAIRWLHDDRSQSLFEADPDRYLVCDTNMIISLTQKNDIFGLKEYIDRVRKRKQGNVRRTSIDNI